MLLRGCVLVALLFVAFDANAAEDCARATRTLAAGSVPSAEDLAPADCGAVSPGSAVRYDAAMRTVRMTRTVQADEIIAAVPPAMTASVSPGQKLYISVHVGPVVVQREVEALQPANPGQKLFVRSADGQVMSVVYGGEDQ